mgnify:FL=1
MKKLFPILVLILSTLIGNSFFNIKENIVRAQLITLLIDDSFNDFEKDQIYKAVQEWERGTNKIVSFTSSMKNTEQIVYLQKTHSDDSEVNFINEVNNQQFTGYALKEAWGWRILIVRDLIPTGFFKRTIIHELGHVLHLRHLARDHTAMNPYLNKGSDCLTYEDLFQFCDLYKCPISKMNYCD